MCQWCAPGSQHKQEILQGFWGTEIVRVLTDTGPLVAILSSTDQYHEVCLQTVQNLHGPLLTCWPVITEAAWLLQGTPGAFERLLRSISDGVVEILPVAGKEAAGVAAIMKQYGSLRPQFADAVLVYLAGRENIRTIFTLDRRDFSVYRAGRKGALRIVPE